MSSMTVDRCEPRRHRVAVPWGELVRAECAVPDTAEDVALLAKAILHRKRDYWIVVLTARQRESVPSVSPMAVREVVGADVPLYFLRRRLAIHLRALLPPGLDVQGGAIRVYRLGARSDPWAHPRMRDRAGEHGQDVLDKLGEIFTPKVAGVPGSRRSNGWLCLSTSSSARGRNMLASWVLSAAATKRGSSTCLVESGHRDAGWAGGRLATGRGAIWN